MKIKFGILAVLFFINSIMSCQENKVQEFSMHDFTITYIKDHPSLLNLNSIIIRNPDWTIYPPTNDMPFNAHYYSIPKFINDFRHLQTLVLDGVFIIELPNELVSMNDLRHLTFSLGTKSDIDSVCHTLMQISKLETLNLTGSVISDDDFNKIRLSLPNVQVIDVIRAMQNETRKRRDSI